MEITVSEFDIPEGSIEIVVGYSAPAIGTGKLPANREDRGWEHLMTEAHLTLPGPKTINRRYRYRSKLASLNRFLDDDEAYPLHPLAAKRQEETTAGETL